MGGSLLRSGGPIRSQIALEFMIIYAIVLIIFVVVFALIANERSVSLAAQQASIMQLLSQNIASYINQALQAGSGYTVTVPLGAGIGLLSYNISVSTTGLVIATTVVGKENITGITLSSARRLFINGTITASGNGIQLYRIPVYTGSVRITNAGGIILVDEPALQVPALVAPVSLSQPAAVDAPYFNGANSLISAGKSNNLVVGNSLTLDAWVYLNQVNSGATTPYLDNPIIGEISSAAQPFMLSVTSTGRPVFLLNWGGTFSLLGSGAIMPRALYNIAATYNTTSGTETLYVNGNAVATSSTALTLSGSSNVIIGGSPQNKTYLNGYVIDAQVYNTSLTAGQIALIYSGGLAASPTSNLPHMVGWWPLNGNANDYSGYGSSATPYNVTFRYSVDTLAQTSTLGGVAAPGVPLGFASASNLLGGYNSLVGNSSTIGAQSTLLISNGFSGNSFVQAVAFNGNLSTVRNLIGWWPLDLGNTNSIGEYSGRSIGGTFVNSNYGYLFNRTNTLVGQFNGANSYISSTPFPVVANTLTVSVWVYPTAVSQSSFGSGTGGSIIDQNENGGSQGWNLGVKSTDKLWFWPSTGNDRYSTANIPLNRWTYVAVTYSQNTLDIYINGSLDSSQAMPAPDGSAAFFKVGAKSWTSGYWEGSLANLQVYNTSLSSGQVAALYSRGLSSVPLPNQGLAGWWPLYGSPNSYANVQVPFNSVASGFSYNSISFTSSAVPPGSIIFPTFNGIAKVTFPSNVLPSKNLCNITIAAWAYDSGMLSSLGGVFNFSNTGKDDISMNDNSVRFEVASPTVPNSWTFTPGYSFRGNWVFLATTLSNGISAGYLNGLQAGTPQSNSIGCINVDSAKFGYNGAYMNGSIADVQIYNSSLSQTQIQQLYLQGIPAVVQLNTSLG